MSSTRFKIDDWTVDPDLGRVFNDKNEETRLEPKAMEVLVYLAKRAGEAVTRQELEGNVWSGTVVSYEALSVTINKIRKALGDTSRKPRYIETLSKRGYRLIAPVIHESVSNETQIVVPNNERSTGTRSRARAFVALLAVALVAVLGYAVYRIGGNTRPALPDYISKADISIAVLPFANSSGNADQDYIANGITEDVITDLSRLSRLLVISRSSVLGYAGTNVTAETVGRELGVRYVLTGDIRRSGDHIRITTQLTDAASNVQVWADRFDKPTAELISVQDEITRKIVAALVIRLSDEEQIALKRRYTDNLEAHDFYMRGRALYGSITKEGNNLARKMFERAIELDPKFARAYGALALTYVDDYRRKWGGDTLASAERALEIARKAVSIDKDEAIGHWVLGYVYLYGKKQPEAAIKSGEQALILYPSFADAYALLGSASSFLGRSDDGIRLTRFAMRLNPKSSVVYYSNLGRDYYFKGEFDEAIKNLKEAISGNYNYLNAHLYLAATFARINEIDDARWEIDKIHTLDPGFSLSYWASTQPYASAEQLNRLVIDLRKAGAPK